MTENEAIFELKDIRIQYVGGTEECKHIADAIAMAIQALEEIQQYRAIGTVEKIEQNLSELKRWHTTEINMKIKNVFANNSTLICHNCDHKDEYIEELEAEIEEYHAIGTPEECRAAVEKQKAKKPIIEYEQTHDCVTEIEWKCPVCGTNYVELAPCGEWCRYCGTKFDWSDEE